MAKPNPIDCPHCQQSLTVRSSRVELPTLKSLYLLCTNVDCAASFGGQISITHGISPSACPNPEVHLRMTPPRKVAANDDHLPRVTKTSAPEVAPPPANDSDELGEAVGSH